MSLPANLLPTTCDIYRGNPPSGGAAATNVPCQLISSYADGAQMLNSNMRQWTHYLLLDSSADIRDSPCRKAAIRVVASGDRLTC